MRLIKPKDIPNNELRYFPPLYHSPSSSSVVFGSSTVGRNGIGSSSSNGAPSYPQPFGSTVPKSPPTSPPNVPTYPSLRRYVTAHKKEEGDLLLWPDTGLPFPLRRDSITDLSNGTSSGYASALNGSLSTSNSNLASLNGLDDPLAASSSSAASKYKPASRSNSRNLFESIMGNGGMGMALAAAGLGGNAGERESKYDAYSRWDTLFKFPRKRKSENNYISQEG